MSVLQRDRRARAAFSLAVVGLVIYCSIPKPPLKEGLSLSKEIYDREHRLLRLTLSSDDKYRRWVSLDKISPILIQATLLQEDRYFYWHPGVNPYALTRAFWKTYVEGGRRMGASTITMQLARIRYGINSSMLKGKFVQMARAMQLERHYSKREILEAYFNLVPYGGNIEGIGSAGLIYFAKETDDLTLSEALALCVIPKSPAKRAFPGNKENDSLYGARIQLFERWLRLHPEDKEKRPIFLESLAAYPASRLPFHAPHFVDSIIKENLIQPRIDTTIDLPLQNLLEKHVRSYVERKKSLGIQNTSAMLVDFRDMEVRAVVGSANFFNTTIEGQVNGTQARRSPGSTLKPFIYALGMDQGIVHPMSMLKDAPMSFGGFNPENFDRDFKGPIHARDALIRSRNVPAVRVALQLKDPSLYDFLKRTGLSPLKKKSHYGLALVLGGAEMTMEELSELYAMLANGGVLRPLRTYVREESQEGTRLLSPEASFMVLDILKDNPRPGQFFRQEWTRDSFPVHWKTGTSFGFRDAWSIGVFGPYVLAVWAGNFDGEGNPAFIGVEAAAPLMFQIVDAVRLHERNFGSPFVQLPENVAKVEVCSVSGQIPGPYCRHSVETWFIPGKSPIKTCDIHREVLVDIRTDRRACVSGVPWTRSKIYEFWPSDLLKIFKRAGIPRRVPPPDNPRCSLQVRAGRGIPPIITSPQQGVSYTLRAESAGRERVPFAAVTDADVRWLYWFLDEKFVGKSKSGKPFFVAAEPGKYMVRVVDDQGRSHSRDFHVTVVQ